MGESGSRGEGGVSGEMRDEMRERRDISFFFLLSVLTRLKVWPVPFPPITVQGLPLPEEEKK